MGSSFFGRTSDDWIARHSRSHRHPVNRLGRTVGIPLIALLLTALAAATLAPNLWPAALVLFAAGWILEFIGQAMDGKPPEFLPDWRFVFVGVPW